MAPLLPLETSDNTSILGWRATVRCLPTSSSHRGSMACRLSAVSAPAQLPLRATQGACHPSMRGGAA